ncbi:MAG TPA: MFS transporter [Acidiphilium sp.]|nr:MFS transporter [Acidiphilium sp.]HQU22903.1 MFS transporter [Acidiphilium sp.]
MLLDRRFAALFWCQGFAAFNDNFLKSALTVLLLYRHGPAATPLVALAGGVFIAPFVFLSGLGGELADRTDKARMASILKLIEIAAAAVAVAGFLLNAVPILFAALFAFGLLAALFSPVKYGILPELLHSDELPQANALIDFATFLAILAGTALGAALGATHPLLLAFLVMLAGLASFAASTRIPRHGAAQPGLIIRANLAASSAALIRILRTSPALWRAALVSSWFWFAGITALTLLAPLVKLQLHRGPHAVTLGLALFSLGIGAGSFLAARLMRGRLTLAPALPGSIALGALMLLLGLAVGQSDLSFALVLALLFAIAAAGGLIAVPSLALVQALAPTNARARAVAGANVLNALAMIVASVALALLLHARVTPSAMIAGFGGATLLISVLWAVRR